MRTIVGLETALVAGMLCAAPAAAQDEASTSSPPLGTCRQVTGQAEIDGVMQPISGLACLQSDGTWQIVQNMDGNWGIPESDYAYYYGYGPWYWGPPVVFGAGASFVFIDRFHHFHHFDHFHFHHFDNGHMHVTFRGNPAFVRGGWGGPHAWGSPHGWGGMGGGGGFHRH